MPTVHSILDTRTLLLARTLPADHVSMYRPAAHMNDEYDTAQGPTPGSDWVHGQWRWRMRAGSPQGAVQLSPGDGPPEVVDVDVSVAHVPAPSLRSLATGERQRVLDRVSWTNPRVRLPGVADALELPLTFRFLLGYYYAQSISPSGEAMPTRSTRFPLPTRLQNGVMYVYGYRLDGFSLTPFSDADKARDAMQIMVPDQGSVVSGAPGNTVSVQYADIVVLAAVSFAVSELRNDFEPTGLAWMCRLWPQVTLVANTPLDQAEVTTRLARPASTTTPSQEMSQNLGIALCADRNSFSVGLAPPTWDDVFDYVLSTEISYASGRASTTETFTAIHHTHLGDGTPVRSPHATARTLPASGDPAESDLRQTWQNLPDPSVPDSSINYVLAGTAVSKTPGQGEFDNVHIAPTMLTSLGPVTMAPLCAHDCFHMHWRWGTRVGGLPLWGFSPPAPDRPSLPHAEAGAPMVPRNQDVTIALTNNHALEYRVTCHGPIPAWSEQIILHHGAAQALHVETLAEAGVSASYPAHIGAGGGFPGFYWYLQYRDQGVERISFPHGIGALRRL